MRYRGSVLWQTGTRSSSAQNPVFKCFFRAGVCSQRSINILCFTEHETPMMPFDCWTPSDPNIRHRRVKGEITNAVPSKAFPSFCDPVCRVSIVCRTFVNTLRSKLEVTTILTTVTHQTNQNPPCYFVSLRLHDLLFGSFQCCYYYIYYYIHIYYI